MEPYVGELRVFAFGQIPINWMVCDGRLLQITQNQALYSLIGKIYGGDGVTTFALPDLRGKTMLQFSNATGTLMGNTAGTETVALTTQTVPQHTHSFNMVNAPATVVTNAQNQNNFLGIPAVPATTGSNVFGFTAPANLVALSPKTVASAGGSAAHENRQPYLPLNVCIATIGIYPTRP